MAMEPCSTYKPWHNKGTGNLHYYFISWTTNGGCATSGFRPGCRLLDKAFVAIGDGERAQQIVNGWEAKRMHLKWDEFASTYGPIHRIEGTRIKHTMGPVSLKLYDKAGLSLPALRELLEAANRRYLGFLSTITGPCAGRDKTIRRHLPDEHSGQISRLLKRLRIHGLIEKVGHIYEYYLTQFGKDVIATGLKLGELVIIPQRGFGRVA